jgi:two-component system, chemotaxis family, CheB/CheR fusion protein
MVNFREKTMAKKMNSKEHNVLERDRTAQKEMSRDSSEEPKSEVDQAKTRPEETSPGPEPQPWDDNFPVVGIGASAGGLHALEKLVEHLPVDSGMAFIAVQHLSPDRESMMSQILSRKTTMQVLEAKDGMPLAPNTIYTKPSDRDVMVAKRVLKLVKADKEKALPVDRLFRSMAGDLQDRAIGMVLSGSGSDGALGIREIKGAGGMVIVQDPEEAEYSGMPESAKRTGSVDYLLKIEGMPGVLATYTTSPIQRPRPETETEERNEQNELKGILRTVYNKTRHNFTQYKKSTVHRRICRRMAVNGIDSLSDYARYLRENPDEVDALFKDLIINVTSFFRDKGAFEALKEKAIVPLVTSMEEDDLVRVWVPGCATGEEAYTIGMLFMEAMSEQHKRLKVRIFGSDINPESIATARDALYPEGIAEDVDPGRLKRFFVKADGKYNVESSLREMMIFAVHDIIQDPPFSNVDLVSCRNLLIYMETDLQKKVMSLLDYALKPEGFLFLGTSEGVGNFSEQFSPVDTKWKIFKAEDGEFQRQYDFSFDARPSPEQKFPEPEGRIVKTGGDQEQEQQSGQEGRDGRAEEWNRERLQFPRKRGDKEDIRQIMEQTMLARFAPSGVIVDSEDVILFFQGDTSSFLQPPRGEPRFDILEMAQTGLRSTLSNGLKKARNEKHQITYEDVGVMGKGDGRVDISFIPLTSRTLRQNMILVTFRSKTDAVEGAQDIEDGAADAKVRGLEQELYSVKQDLQATIEELETSNEELKSSNEELQANNEELQSTNEELDTSREELQSTNEELETINAEMQKKNEELESLNDDIRNIFAYTTIGTVVLDTDLRVKRFTPSATRIFNLIGKDIGRELTDIASNLEYDDLEQDTHRVLDTLNMLEKEVRTKDGRWFIMRMFPYRTSDNVIRGVVLNFTDVTDLKFKEQEANEARIQAEAILETTRQPLLVLDSGLKVISANNAFSEAFNVSRMETEGSRIYTLGNAQWNIPELRTLLEEIIPKNTVFKNFEVEHDFPNVGRKKMLVDARRIDREGDRPYLILIGFQEK